MSKKKAKKNASAAFFGFLGEFADTNLRSTVVDDYLFSEARLFYSKL